MSRKKRHLCIGDPIEVYAGRGMVYKSRLEDIMEDETLLVSIPTTQGVPMNVQKDQGLQLYYFKNDGRYRVNVRMTGYVKDGGISLMCLKPVSDAQKQQRRNSFRLDKKLTVFLTKIEIENSETDGNEVKKHTKETAESINISATGIALRVKKVYNEGDKVSMEIYLNWPQPESEPLFLAGEVRMVANNLQIDGFYHLGVQYLKPDKASENILTRYIFAQERQQIQQNRLLEDGD